MVISKGIPLKVETKLFSILHGTSNIVDLTLSEVAYLAPRIETSKLDKLVQEANLIDDVPLSKEQLFNLSKVVRGNLSLLENVVEKTKTNQKHLIRAVRDYSNISEKTAIFLVDTLSKPMLDCLSNCILNEFTAKLIGTRAVKLNDLVTLFNLAAQRFCYLPESYLNKTFPENTESLLCNKLAERLNKSPKCVCKKVVNYGGLVNGRFEAIGPILYGIQVILFAGKYMQNNERLREK